MVGASTDSISSTCDSDIAVVVAIQTFFRCALGGVGKYGTIADCNSSCGISIGVNSIITVAINNRQAAIENNLTFTVHAIIVGLVVVSATIDCDAGLGLNALCAI